jgi:four helix bundle protein
MKLEELRIYTSSMDWAEKVWEIVLAWQHFERTSIGKQWLTAADSISANIAEGFGRYHFKENKQFCFYARGSATESFCWLIKAHNRKLISDQQFKILNDELQSLCKQINSYIKSIGPVKP